jgi:hypothetical protein
MSGRGSPKNTAGDRQQNDREKGCGQKSRGEKE